MDFEIFLSKFKTSRRELSRALHLIKENEDLSLKINDKWTIIEHVSHILWYEDQMITMLQNKDMSANKEIWQKPVHERNKAVHEIQDKLTEQNILRLNETIPTTLQTLIEELDNNKLDNSNWITNMPLEWKPWMVMAGNTFEHYESHLRQFVSHCNYLG